MLDFFSFFFTFFLWKYKAILLNGADIDKSNFKYRSFFTSFPELMRSYQNKEIYSWLVITGETSCSEVTLLEPRLSGDTEIRLH